MEIRLQHILLRSGLLKIGLLLTLVWSGTLFAANDKKGLNINSELFDVGIVTGVINIEDFASDMLFGANVTFKASEYFFLQYNYVQAGIGQSSYENLNGDFALENRDFVHYDLLLGYNIFQGEFFTSGKNANLSNLYIVGGFGGTELGGENNFTYTIGAGYLVEFSRKYLVRVDYRNYIFDTSLIIPGQETTVNNSQFSIGVGYLF